MFRADFLRAGLLVRLGQLSAVTILSLFATGCSTKPVLHVIGVHVGKAPPGVDDRPWWEKCNDDQKDKQMIARPAPSPACHMLYAGKDPEKEVVVNVSDNSKPIVLALNAYNKTHWKVFATQGVKITKVILSGYHPQRISGIPLETVIEIYTYESSPCEKCWQSPKYFYSYEAPPEQLKEITGLEAASFQGRYTGEKFSIFPGIKKFE